MYSKSDLRAPLCSTRHVSLLMVTGGASSLMKTRHCVVWIGDTTSGCGDYFGPDGSADGSSPCVSHLSSSSSSSSFHLRPLPPKNAQSRLSAVQQLHFTSGFFTDWNQKSSLSRKWFLSVFTCFIWYCCCTKLFCLLWLQRFKLCCFKSLVYCWVVLIVSSGSYSITFSLQQPWLLPYSHAFFFNLLFYNVNETKRSLPPQGHT